MHQKVSLHYNKENKIKDYIDKDLSQWSYGKAFDWQALETLASSCAAGSASQSNDKDNKNNRDNNDDTKDEREKNNPENKENKEKKENKKKAHEHVATLRDNVINEMKCENGIFIRLSTRIKRFIIRINGNINV